MVTFFQAAKQCGYFKKGCFRPLPKCGSAEYKKIMCLVTTKPKTTKCAPPKPKCAPKKKKCAPAPKPKCAPKKKIAKKTDTEKARARFKRESKDPKADKKQNAKLAKNLKDYSPGTNDWPGVDTIPKKRGTKRKAPAAKKGVNSK